MDSRVRSLRLLIAAALAAAGVAAGAAGNRTLDALTWIAPGREAAALTRQPAACLGEAAGDPAVIAGRALFNAPQLLGGQAARAGISCASCHSNGRGNPHFQLAGISAGPGTADVSASFFSVARGNATFDPKPIPDLAQPGRVSHDPQTGDLERFLRGLIVEEFSGPPPPESALADLAAYVRAVRPCPDGDDEPVGMTDRIALFRDSVRAAARSAAAGDHSTALALIGAARGHLGLIDERLAVGDHRRVRRDLLEASRSLQTIGEGPVSPVLLEAMLTRFDRRVASRLEAAESASLYRSAIVNRWLAGRAR